MGGGGGSGGSGKPNPALPLKNDASSSLFSATKMTMLASLFPPPTNCK